MIIARTIAVTDPFARANVMEALAGPGGPAGVTSCTARDGEIALEFDAEQTAPALIDALIAVESRCVPSRAPAPADLAVAVACAAHGLSEPALDVTRVIESYLS